MGVVRLPDIDWGDDELNAAFRKWRESIEAALNWSVKGHADFIASATGFALLVKGDSPTLTAVVATGGITARVNSTTLGEGNAVLKFRTTGATMVSGPTVKVYNSFAVVIPADTFIEVARDGADYKLQGSDCPA